ncbi:MAG: MarR family transcriptional regulator [Candidatus Latescibacteria bacterium]|jgi:DNA-binding MarR family transcriptional regulator|nr:MarR family transcriptional regulator [Candidatus Latescibacterota bacterium]
MDRVKSTVGFIANKVAWKYRHVLTRVIRQGGYDITPEHWIILASLRSQGSVSQIDLARATYKDKANITRLLKKLLSMNLVKRARCSDDRRHFKVSLTPEGRVLLKLVTPKLKIATDAIDRHMGEETVAYLKQELGALSDHLDVVIQELEMESVVG